MSAKTKTIYVCQECGSQSPRWVGRCQNCESWNSYVEERTAPAAQAVSARGRDAGTKSQPLRLSDVVSEAAPRITTGIAELDRVLGGGVVPGSVTLIGGDPGIGKSTLTLQAVARLSDQGRTVLYVSGEESVQQTKMRADRLDAGTHESLLIVSETNAALVEDHIRRIKPDVVVIDSIQVLHHPDIASSPGSVSQVRECASFLTQMAKHEGVALIFIGHVTKEGAIAGPRVLEHIVDTVLYFEGERYTTYRIIRGIKNRFGSTNEIGVFEMTARGLLEVANPSEMFLAERPEDAAGSVVLPVIEGSRPFLVEIQGLVSRSTYGVARQKTQGFDANRLALLIAVLEKRLDMNIGDKDVFLNVVGGMKVADPAADLGVILAVASGLLDQAVPGDMVVFGEVGLSAEVRSVTYLAARLNEAVKLGFKRCILPRNNLTEKTRPISGLELVPVAHVREAIEAIQ
ncbi:MAG: DNA repair protein RadA [Candidatus Omnitrophota bacterium]